jgi:hypothetical protein
MKKIKLKLSEFKVTSFISDPSLVQGGNRLAGDIERSPDCMYTDTGNC